MNKIKNILAENLIRFGVKNLSEADKKKVQEQFEPGETQEAYTVFPLTISVPFKKDSAGQMRFDENGSVKFFAKNEKGTQGTSLENYEAIVGLDFSRAGTFVNKLTSKKDAQGNILGAFKTYGQKELAKYLQSMVGKTLPSGDKTLLVSLRNAETKRAEAFYASTTKFEMYDSGAPSPVAPR